MTTGMFKVFMYEHLHQEFTDEQVSKIIWDATCGSDLESLLSQSDTDPPHTTSSESGVRVSDRMLSFVEFCSIVYSSWLTVEGRQAEAKLQVDKY